MRVVNGRMYRLCGRSEEFGAAAVVVISGVEGDAEVEVGGGEEVWRWFFGGKGMGDCGELMPAGSCECGLCQEEGFSRSHRGTEKEGREKRRGG